MFGIRVPLSMDDYVWVMDSDMNAFNPKPLLFKTREEALDNAKIWGPLAFVKEYEEFETIL